MSKLLTCLLFVLFAYNASAQNRQLSGTVTDASNNAVASATVGVKGTTNFTSTGADGRFSLSVPSGNITLQVTSVGFDSRDVSVSGSDNNISITKKHT